MIYCGILRHFIAYEFARFILKLRHSAHLAKPGETVQNPRQLAVRRDAALAVQMNGLVIQRQPRRRINPGVTENALIQLAVVDWRGEAV